MIKEYFRLVVKIVRKIVAFSVSDILSICHTFLYKGKFNSIGDKTVVYYKSIIDNKIVNGVKIGRNCLIGRAAKKYHAGMPFYTTLLNDGENSHIYIGDFCRINGAYIHSQNYVEIGNRCVFASGISIIDSNGHIVNSADRTIGRDEPQGISIGDNVWIGLNSIILKNTKIGNNCIVSAGSIVKGVFPDGSIIQGNPAVIVGKVKIV